jgi:hypothetical protein
VHIGPYIRVPEDAGKEKLEQLHATMQTSLEEAQSIAESAFRQG